MKKILFISFLFILTLSYAQKEKGFPLTVARYYDNDTVSINYFVDVSSVELSYPEFTSNSLIYYENGKKQKMHLRRVKFIEFVDYQGNFKRIVSPRFINDFLLEDQMINYQVNYLFVEMYVGKISWYRRYMRDSYDHSEMRSDYYILDGKWYKRNQFISAKKFFEFLLSDYPELQQIIKEKKFSIGAKKYDAQIMDLLLELEDFFKNEKDLNSIQNE